MVIHGGPYQAAGISDIIGCYDGRFWAFEVKTPDKWNKSGYNLSELQTQFLMRIRKSGGVGFCVCSVKQVAWLMDSHLAYGPMGPIISKFEELV